MRKLLLAMLLLYVGIAKAQTFGDIGFGINSPSIHANIGYLSQLDVSCKAQIMGGLIIPTNPDVPRAVYVLAGGQLFSFNDGDMHFTPSVGISNLWLPNNEKIERMTGVYMAYALDFSKRIDANKEAILGITNTNNFTFLTIKFRMYLKSIE